jgi:hypothetical protein
VRAKLTVGLLGCRVLQTLKQGACTLKLWQLVYWGGRSPDTWMRALKLNAVGLLGWWSPSHLNAEHVH